MIYTVPVQPPDDLAAFRALARRFLAAGVPPADIAWTGEPSLFPAEPPPDGAAPHVPRSFVELAQAVACHREDVRWTLLYEALWRITTGEKALLDQAADPLVHRLRRMEKAVRHDTHRMTAFLRFREAGEDHYVAWYEPQHRILRRATEFFTGRFANMRFSILTPDLTLHWDRETAAFAPGLTREAALSADLVEAWWQRYYAAIFNPARANERLMKSHMPKRFWHNLPEAHVIAELVSNAAARTQRMIAGAE